jgi:competence protein ComEC
MTGTLFNLQSVPIYALAFLAGIAGLQYFSFLPAIFWVSFLPLLLLAGWLNPAVKLLAICLAGFLWALLHAHDYAKQVLPEHLAGQTIQVEGQIIGIPRRDGRVQRFMLRVTSFNLQESVRPGIHSLPEKLKLSWYGGKQRLQAGQHWRLMLRLKPPHGFINAGGFDYERWLYQNRIHATGYVKKHVSNRQVLLPSAYSMDRLRDSIAGFISAHTEDFSGLIAALAVGHKGDIPSQQWRVLTRTGTNHLMAISGLHIGLIAAWVFWLARRLVPAVVLKKWPCTQFAALISLLAAGFYAVLAGLGIPTQRAMVMLSVVLAGILFRRQIRPLNSLSWALIAVLILDPVSILAAGFWFSFLAVAVIAYSFSGRLVRASGPMQWGRLQWVIALALFPVSLFLFQQTSLVAPLANLLFVPWVSLIVVPLVLLASLSLSFSDVLAQWLYQLAEAAFALSWPLLQWLSELSLASWQQAPAPLVYVFMALLGVALLLAPRGLSHRWLGLILLLPCLLYRPELPARGDVWVDILDVGQGLAIVIQTQRHIMVYDTGPRFSPSFDTGERVVVPYLRHHGIKRLDKLLISHADNDHIGGAASLIKLVPITEIIGQGIDRLNHRHKTVCVKGQKWRWDGVDFEILHPDTGYKKRNNRGCVLRIDNGRGSALITADIEQKVERSMVAFYPDKLKADALLVPHHGSKTSSTRAFIQAVDPDYAIVSAGYRNRFRHPSRVVVERYAALGVKIHNTAEQGGMRLTLDAKKGVSLAPGHRIQTRHYWNHGRL